MMIEEATVCRACKSEQLSCDVSGHTMLQVKSYCLHFRQERQHSMVRIKLTAGKSAQSSKQYSCFYLLQDPNPQRVQAHKSHKHITH